MGPACFDLAIRSGRHNQPWPSRHASLLVRRTTHTSDAGNRNHPRGSAGGRLHCADDRSWAGNALHGARGPEPAHADRLHPGRHSYAMTRLIPYPFVSLSLWIVWLVLNQSIDLMHILT